MRLPRLVPGYVGFNGEIVEKKPGTFETRGVFTVKGNVTTITELPIGMSTEKYSAFVDSLYTDKKITDFAKGGKPETVDFKLIGFRNPTLAALKLTSTVSTKNLTFFTETGHVAQYGNMESVLHDACRYRYDAYIRRLAVQLRTLLEEIAAEELRIRFLQDVLSGSLRLMGRGRRGGGTGSRLPGEVLEHDAALGDASGTGTPPGRSRSLAGDAPGAGEDHASLVVGEGAGRVREGVEGVAGGGEVPYFRSKEEVRARLSVRSHS